MIWFVLICMIFFHILDDYHLQGNMKNMKQKDWWRNQSEYNFFYHNDYKAVLLCHGLSWSFMIMLPMIVYQFLVCGTFNNLFLAMFVVQAIIHAFFDDLKANKHSINLVQDQFLHLVQIIFSFLLFYYSGVSIL